MSGAEHNSTGPHFVLTVDGDIHGVDNPENRELVRRIHACVRACDGISTTELEQGVVQDMRRVIGQVAPLLQSRVRPMSASTSCAKPPIVIHESHVAPRAMLDAC